MSPNSVMGKNVQMIEDLKKLRDDYELLAKEFEDCKRQKEILEECLTDEKKKNKL